MSSKKRNAFFHFMRERKPQLEADGKVFPGGLKDVANFVSSEWQAMSAEEKKAFDYDGKKETKKTNDPPKFANPTEKARWEDKKKKELEQALAIEIGTLVQNDQVADMAFIIIDFNVWGMNNDGFYVPAEIGMVAFSLNKGVFDNYGTIIDPRKIDLGMGFSVLTAADEFDLPRPPFDYDEEADNIKYMLNCIFWFINKRSDNLSPGYLFCLRESTDIVNSCLQWLCKQTGLVHKFSVYPLEHLVIKLAQLNETKEGDKDMSGLSPSSQSTEAADESGSPSVGNAKNEGKGTTENPGCSNAAKELPGAAFGIPFVTEEEIWELPEETSGVPPMAEEEEAANAKRTEVSVPAASNTPKRAWSFKFWKERPVVTPEEREAAKWKRVRAAEPLTFTDEEIAYYRKLAENSGPDPLVDARTVLSSVGLYGMKHLACFHHLQNCKVVHKCSLSQVNFYAYNAIRYLLPKFGIPAQPSVHFPCRELVEFETRNHLSTLRTWGLGPRTYPTYMDPDRRREKMEAEKALIEAQSFHREETNMEDLPLSAIPPLFRPRPPSPTYILIDRKPANKTNKK